MKKLLFLSVLLGLTLLGRAQDAVFIAHPGVSDTISADDAKNILLGIKTKWDGGAGNIKLIVLAEGPVHEKVIRDYTQRSPDQFDKYWKKLVFTGKGIAPAAAKTDAEVVEFVSKNTGAFGYVAKESAGDKVKILPIK
jgi:ABC-type phosphate transport system substrate-binding protein